MCHQHQLGNSCWLPAQSPTRKIYLDVLGTVWWRVPPGISCGWFISARKRSLQRLCFHRCLSVHEGEWVWQTPPSAGIPPWAGTPPGQAPHQAGTPWAGTPAGQVPPGRYTPSSWADTSPFPGWYTRPWQTVNKRAVRILLECILV